MSALRASGRATTLALGPAPGSLVDRGGCVSASAGEDVVEHAAGAGQVAGDLGFGDAGGDQVLGRGDVFRGEFAGRALVDALGLGDRDAFALPLSDQGAFQLGDGAELVTNGSSASGPKAGSLASTLRTDVSPSCLQSSLVWSRTHLPVNWNQSPLDIHCSTTTCCLLPQERGSIQ